MLNKTFSVLALLLLGSPTSHATYDVISSLEYGVAWSQEGEGTRSEDIIQGYGDKIPLELALKQVTPAGWDLLFTDRVNKNAVVSWKGNRPWARILKQIADQAGLIFEIQHDGSNILVSKSSQVNGLGAVIHKAGSANQKTFTMEAKVWELKRGETLSRNLQEWGNKVGWTVVWDYEDGDFIIDVPTIMTGSLTGAIDKLLAAYREQKIMLHVVSTVHPYNRTIRIHQKLVK